MTQHFLQVTSWRCTAHLLAMLLVLCRKLVMPDRMVLASGRVAASEVKSSSGAHLWPVSLPRRNAVLLLRHLSPATTCKDTQPALARSPMCSGDQVESWANQGAPAVTWKDPKVLSIRVRRT